MSDSFLPFSSFQVPAYHLRIVTRVVVLNKYTRPPTISIPAADVTYELNPLLLMDAATGHVCSTLFSVC